jgi:hypothetical protein
VHTVSATSTCSHDVWSIDQDLVGSRFPGSPMSHKLWGIAYFVLPMSSNRVSSGGHENCSYLNFRRRERRRIIDIYTWHSIGNVQADVL